MIYLSRKISIFLRVCTCAVFYLRIYMEKKNRSYINIHGRTKIWEDIPEVVQILRCYVRSIQGEFCYRIYTPGEGLAVSFLCYVFFFRSFGRLPDSWLLYLSVGRICFALIMLESTALSHCNQNMTLFIVVTLHHLKTSPLTMIIKPYINVEVLTQF